MTSSSFVFRRFSLHVAFAALAALAGCSYSQMHGYRVVHTDSEVRYEPGRFALHSVENTNPTHSLSAPIERALRVELGERAPEFVPTATPGNAEFAVRVHVVNTARTALGTSVEARIEILDPEGNVTTVLQTEHDVAGSGHAAAWQVGRELGARLAHYLRERERLYHW